jgi:outer membrane protein assembly factor BamB
MTHRSEIIFRYVLLACILFVFAMSSLAKRAKPKPVAPVVYAGIRYSADGNGVDEYVVASDASSGKPLWTVRVAHNDHDPHMEQDVQDVYVTDLKAIKGELLVRDEKSRCYSIDIATKRVNKQLWCHGF